NSEPFEGSVPNQNDLAFWLRRAAGLFQTDRERTRGFDGAVRPETGPDRTIVRDSEYSRTDRLRILRVDHPELVVFSRSGWRQLVQLQDSILLLFIPDDDGCGRLERGDLRFQHHDLHLRKRVPFLQTGQFALDTRILLFERQQFAPGVRDSLVQGRLLKAENSAHDRERGRQGPWDREPDNIRASGGSITPPRGMLRRNDPLRQTSRSLNRRQSKRH